MSTINQIGQTRLFGSFAAMLGFMVVLTQSAVAVDYTWSGASGEASWNDPANWGQSINYPGKVAGDGASITMDADIVLPGVYTFRYFYKNGSYDEDVPAVINITGGGMALTGGTDPRFEVGAKLFDNTSASTSRAAEMFVNGTDIRVGNPDLLGRVAVAYCGNVDMTSKGFYKQVAGSFRAYLNSFYVACGTTGHTSSPVQGTFDLREVDDVEITVARDFIIHGNRDVGLGELLLGKRVNLVGGSQAPLPPADSFRAGHLDGSTRSSYTGTSVFSVVSGNVDLRYHRMYFGMQEAGGNATLSPGYLKATASFGPETAVKLEANELMVGAGTSNGTIVESLFDATGTENGEITVNSMFKLGSGKTTCMGEMYLGTNWSFVVGTPDNPANLIEFAANWNIQNWQTNYSTFYMKGGSFEAYCTNYLAIAYFFRGSTNVDIDGRVVFDGLTNVVIQTPKLAVGSWAPTTGNVYAPTLYGLLDLQTSENIQINVDTFLLGNTPSNLGTGDTRGLAYLGQGSAIVGSLALACPVVKTTEIINGAYGTLVLDGMQMSVTNSFMLGNRGVITSIVNQVSSGIVLSDALADNTAASFDEKWCGTNTIVFVTPPTVTKRDNQIIPLNSFAGASAVYWGFAWEGEHTEDLLALWTAGKIQVVDNLTDEYANRVDVFYDEVTATTYIGFPYRESPAATRVELF